MRLLSCWLAGLACVAQALAAERTIDFNQYPVDQTPPGFVSSLAGKGQPGVWKVITEPEPAAPSQVAGTHASSRPKILAQLSQDGTDERFPLLIFNEESYGDFSLTTKFKMVEGVFEQMAGIAFRLQDTNNFYYFRASAIGNNFKFGKVVNGQRLVVVGPSLDVPRGVWHELKIECKGNRISCFFNGKEVIPPATDSTFTSGRIAFWTKSDSVSYFGPTRITFTPHETLAQVLVREAVERYPRLVGLRIYSRIGGQGAPKVIASRHADEMGEPGGKVEADVIERDVMYYGKEKKVILVTLPLHDRNGEVAGAVRLTMDSFPGQTEQNALARARPIVKEMENRIRTAQDLVQ